MELQIWFHSKHVLHAKIVVHNIQWERAVA